MVWSCFPQTKRASRWKPLCGIVKLVRERECSGIYRTSLIIWRSHNSARWEMVSCGLEERVPEKRPTPSIATPVSGLLQSGEYRQEKKPAPPKLNLAAGLPPVRQELTISENTRTTKTSHAKHLMQSAKLPLTQTRNSWYGGIGKKLISKRRAKGETV